MNTCTYCAAPISGRADKRFCDSLCRSAFHNEKMRKSRSEIRRVNTILQHNHQILLRCIELVSSPVERSLLSRLGYRFDYFTGYWRESESSLKLIYDVGVQECDEEVLLYRKNRWNEFEPL